MQKGAALEATIQSPYGRASVTLWTRLNLAIVEAPSSYGRKTALLHRAMNYNRNE